MSEDLGRMLLHILETTDYRIIGKQRMQKLWKPNEGEIAGLYVGGNQSTVFIRKDLRRDEFRHVQLHEFAHAYFDSVNKGFFPEEEVEKLAYEWQVKMDGVYK